MMSFFKNKVGVVLTVFAGMLISAAMFSCGNLKVPEPPAQFDYEAQYKIDSQLIEEYIEEFGIEGVQYSESGLRYKLLEEGDGPYPDRDDIVSVHYTLSLLDSSVLQSTWKDVEIKYDLYDTAKIYSAYTFNVGSGNVSGFNEGSKLMKLNDRYLFIIPSKLGYGNQARTTSKDTIPANSVLVYDVKMIEIR